MRDAYKCAETGFDTEIDCITTHPNFDAMLVILNAFDDIPLEIVVELREHLKNVK